MTNAADEQDTEHDEAPGPKGVAVVWVLHLCAIAILCYIGMKGG